MVYKCILILSLSLLQLLACCGKNLSQDDQGQYFMDMGGDDAAVIELALVAERVSKITRANPGLKVLVEGDATIAYGLVIDLMDRLQRVGVQDVGLITKPPSG